MTDEQVKLEMQELGRLVRETHAGLAAVGHASDANLWSLEVVTTLLKNTMNCSLAQGKLIALREHCRSKGNDVSQFDTILQMLKKAMALFQQAIPRVIERMKQASDTSEIVSTLESLRYDLNNQPHETIAGNYDVSTTDIPTLFGRRKAVTITKF